MQRDYERIRQLRPLATLLNKRRILSKLPFYPVTIHLYSLWAELLSIFADHSSLRYLAEDGFSLAVWGVYSLTWLNYQLPPIIQPVQRFSSIILIGIITRRCRLRGNFIETPSKHYQWRWMRLNVRRCWTYGQSCEETRLPDDWWLLNLGAACPFSPSILLNMFTPIINQDSIIQRSTEGLRLSLGA